MDADIDADEHQTVELDGVTYSLSHTPPLQSPLVQRHLSPLPGVVPPLSPQVDALSRHVVELSRFDDVQAAFSRLLADVADLKTRLCLLHIHDACGSVLVQQMVALRMILVSPFQNDSLKHFSGIALTLASYVRRCVSVLHRITQALTTLFTLLHAAQHSLNHAVRDQQQTLSALRVQNVSIMQQQSQLLQSLSEYAAQYSQLQASQQRLSRQQTLCNLISFMPSIDQSLQSSYNLRLFQPVSNMIQDVNHQYNQSQRETEQVLAAKRRQREQNKSLMQQLSECEQQIQQATTHLQCCRHQLKHINHAIQRVQAIGVLVLRIITAFKSIAHSCQTLSASQLATLIDLTSSPSSEKPAIQQGDLSVLDASQSVVQPKWSMKTAVKQKFVQYFAQWAALKHCCQHCLKQFPTEEQHTVPQLSWGAYESERGQPHVEPLLPSSSAVTEHQQTSVTHESRDANDASVSST